MATADRIRDAAEPLAHALVAVQDLGVRVPPVDVLIAYHYHGCVVRVADRSSAHRPAVEDAFRAAFEAAGWGVGRARRQRPDHAAPRRAHPAVVRRRSRVRETPGSTHMRDGPPSANWCLLSGSSRIRHPSRAGTQLRSPAW